MTADHSPPADVPVDAQEAAWPVIHRMYGGSEVVALGVAIDALAAAHAAGTIRWEREYQAVVADNAILEHNYEQAVEVESEYREAVALLRGMVDHTQHAPAQVRSDGGCYICERYEEARAFLTRTEGSDEWPG